MLRTLSFFMPAPYMYQYANLSLSASATKAGFITYAPKTGNIRKVGFKISTVTTSQDLKVSVQGVNSSGNPDGVIKGPTNNGFGILSSPASNTFYIVTLNEDVPVTYVDPISVVIEFNDTIGSLYISYVQKLSGILYNNMYALMYTTSWTKLTGLPSILLEFDDGSYAPPNFTWPLSNVSVYTFNSGSNPDEYGIYFKLPFSCEVIRGWCFGDMDQDATFSLYGETTQSAIISSGQRYNTSYAVPLAFFPAPVILLADTWYRATVKPTTTTPSMSLKYFEVLSASIMDSFILGQNCYQTSRVDGGTWTENATRRPLMGLFIDGVDDGIGINYKRPLIVSQGIVREISDNENIASGLFSIDVDGGLQPITDSFYDEEFELDGNNDVMPKE